MRKKYRTTPSKSYLETIMSYDPEEGTFTRACDRKRWKKGQPMGTVAGGYLSINVDRTVYRAHRLAWKIMTGEDPVTGIDHINGDPMDNRWANLRLADQTLNSCNRGAAKNNHLGIKGVSKNRSKFYASVSFRGKRVYRQGFDSAEEAKAAYDRVAQAVHGEFFKA